MGTGKNECGNDELFKGERPMNLRHSSGYIAEHDILKLKPLPKFDVDLNVMGERVCRKMVEVVLYDRKSNGDRSWYVDIVTGSMYDVLSGKSSSYNIEIEKVHK